LVTNNGKQTSRPVGGATFSSALQSRSSGQLLLNGRLLLTLGS